MKKLNEQLRTRADGNLTETDIPHYIPYGGTIECTILSGLGYIISRLFRLIQMMWINRLQYLICNFMEGYPFLICFVFIKATVENFCFVKYILIGYKVNVQLDWEKCA